MNQFHQENGEMASSRHDNRRVKWSYATHRLPDLPHTEVELADRIGSTDGPPRANDVIVAEVLELNRHTRIELGSMRRSEHVSG